MGEAHGSCTEGRAVPVTRQKKIQRKCICAILGEPLDADPHARWLREWLAAAPYSIIQSQETLESEAKRELHSSSNQLHDMGAQLASPPPI